MTVDDLMDPFWCITCFNMAPIYVWGSEKDVQLYTDWLNHDKQVNLWQADIMEWAEVLSEGLDDPEVSRQKSFDVGQALYELKGDDEYEIWLEAQ